MRKHPLAAFGVAGMMLSLPFTYRTMAASASTPSRMPVQSLKIMNYYPAQAGWTQMWTNYSHATTVSDFATIASLGANTVRVIVQPSAVGYPTVASSMRSNFDDVINVATADHLSVQLSLFDQWHNYTDVNNSKSWVSSLLKGEQNNPTIAMVELQNEMPISTSSITWAKALLPYLKTVLPGVPRVISTSGALGYQGVSSLLADLPASDLDAIDVHYYGDPAQAYTELSQVQALAAGRPVFIGETGMSTNNTVAGQEAQARFYEVMGETAQALHLPPPAPWMLNVVTKAGGVNLTTTQSYYGLRLPDGTWNPAASVVKSLYSGVVPQDWDGNMAHEALDEGTILGAWIATDPSAGMPTLYSGASHNGGQSVCYTNTGGTSAAVPTVEQAFPVLTPGESFTVTAWVYRLAGTGNDRISLAAFDPTDTYVGELDSPAAAGSGYWQELTVSGSAPSNVASVQVNLKAGNESGTACWSDVTITTAP